MEPKWVDVVIDGRTFEQALAIGGDGRLYLCVREMGEYVADIPVGGEPQCEEE